MKKTTPAILMLLCLSLSQQTLAVNDQALIQLLKVLHQDGTLTDEKYQTIMQLIETDKTTANTQQVLPKKEPNEQLVNMTKPIQKTQTTTDKIINNGKLEFANVDGDFKVRIGGRLMADAAFYDDDIHALGSGAEIRRARLYVAGTLWKSWQYKLQYDFVGSGNGGIRDAYIQYKGLPYGAIKIGHFKEPFSLQNMTSSKYIAFMERGLPHLFTPDRSLGISYAMAGSNWNMVAGFFGDGIDTPAEEIDQSYAITTRGTYTPIFTKGGQVLHFGLGYSYRDLDDNNNFRFRERPESHVTNTRLIDTGSFDADKLQRFNLEALWIYGPLALQGEYSRADIDRAITSNKDVDFDGYYVEGSWFFTGESLNYNPKKASLGKITPRNNLGNGGYGAWQIATRFSSADLNDQDVRGGEEDNFSIGLNWYPNPNLRFMANYMKVLSLDGGPNPDDEPSIFSLRAQAEF